jgi:hypothetical protein
MPADDPESLARKRHQIQKLFRDAYNERQRRRSLPSIDDHDPPPTPRHLKGNLGGRLPDWAATLADLQLQDRDLKTDETYYMIDKTVAAYQKERGGKMDEEIVPEVAKALGCSTKTVYNALRAMKEKREAEEAHAKAIKDQLTATKRDSLQ